jgi:RNA polymerase sigma factor (sigma-70 family)
MNSEITTTTTKGRFDTETPFVTDAAAGCNDGHHTSSDQGAVGGQKPRVSDADGQALLERFVIGDQDALERLLEAYTPMIFAVFMRRYRLAQEDADDLFQEVLLQLVMKADTIRNVRPWLLGTAFNQARKRIRGLIRDRKLAESFAEEEVTEPVDHEDIKDLVTRGLALAAPADRDLLRLIYIEELSYKEVADQLGRPIGSIGPMRGRALDRLKVTLEELDGRSSTALSTN